MQLYNSRTRALEEVSPLDGKTIRMYTCGPTVYNFAHIGNFRAYIAADVLKRALTWRGFSVIQTMNITDVDDKMIANSQKELPHKQPMDALIEFGEKYTTAFLEDFKTLSLALPDHITKATDYIPQMQSLITDIVHKGYGYEKDGSVYFDVQKYAREKHYGELMNIDMSGFKAGARIDADEYEKEHVQDFALWKAHKEGEPLWEFNLDNKAIPGRPGWHIECSAMAQNTLGVPFDIHTGGVDLKFPHHEDEIAQSVIGYDVDVPVNIWMHNEHLMVEGEKMAKSKHNFYTLRDVLKKGYSPAAIRYVLLATHYRQPLNFTFDGLKAAQENIRKINEVIFLSMSLVEPGKKYREEKPQLNTVLEKANNDFTSALDDDLNISQALAVVFDTIKEINTKKLYSQEVLNWLKDIDCVLGLGVVETGLTPSLQYADPTLQSLLSQRKQARDDKDFALADKLRKDIESQFSVELRDTDRRQEIKKKP